MLPFYNLGSGGRIRKDEGWGVPYLFLDIATIIIPSTAIVIAGATVSPVVPDKKSHTANAMQISPTISLSFLNCITYPPETQAEI